MGYRIEYDGRIDQYEVIPEHKNRFPLLWTVFFCLFLFLTFGFWSEGAEVLRSNLIPGDDAVTVRAVQAMTNDLRSGAQFADAVYTFCRNVIYSVPN